MIRDDPQEQLSFIQLAAAPGIEALDAKCSFQPWHVFHERYAFSACRTAAAGWLYRGRSYFLKDGSTAFLEPGETHRNTTVHKRSDFKVLFIPERTFETYAKELGQSAKPHFRIAQTEDPRIFDAVYKVCLAAESGESNLDIETRLMSCMDLVLRQAEGGNATDRHLDLRKPIERAKRLLQDRFAESVSLDELCAESGLSRFHLVRAFGKRVGLPPHAFQVHVRIERARTLLQLGMPPAQVSECVGFADQSHFARHFKKIMRVSPGSYVRRLK